MYNEPLETPTMGEVLKEEFLDPLNITSYKLAKDINVSTSTILDLIHNKRKLTVEMALRLSKYFGNSHKFWLNLQNEIEARTIKKRIESELNKINTYTHIA